MYKPPKPISTLHIALASCVGTAIEFYDFYIYAFASALVIGTLFFPALDVHAQRINTFLIFGLAFVARPLGAIAFGHFGDKFGRKQTLVFSLLFMGCSTFLIGLLPDYAVWGVTASVLLAVLRFCQGLGLGGEWGGAALLAIEHAPPNKRGWYGMFPQLGPSLGFVLAIGSFLLLETMLSSEQMFAWGWRLPFFASALLVVAGLYVRRRLNETPDFIAVMQDPHRVPFLRLVKTHAKCLLLCGTAMSAIYVLFYTTTVFCLSFATRQLGVSRHDFLLLLCLAVLFKVATIMFCAKLSDRVGKRPVLLIGMLATIGVGFLMQPLMTAGLLGIALFLILALCSMAIMLGPIGAFLTSQFPVLMRYSGAGLSYHLGGILGAAVAPVLSEWLVQKGGLFWVGMYISIVGLLALLATLSLRDVA